MKGQAIAEAASDGATFLRLHKVYKASPFLAHQTAASKHIHSSLSFLETLPTHRNMQVVPTPFF
jgi:hypothetical protein